MIISLGEVPGKRWPRDGVFIHLVAGHASWLLLIDSENNSILYVVLLFHYNLLIFFIVGVCWL